MGKDSALNRKGSARGKVQRRIERVKFQSTIKTRLRFRMGTILSRKGKD
jgi:hypothetical protein